MAIDTNLLVQADILQDYFVDKTTGNPLAGGLITFYQDTQRTVLKNVYYQTGSPGNYSYLPFTNPIVLSASGTIQDPNNNDVIPYYYPYDESNDTPTVQTYYVTVYSANQNGTPAVLQFTRQNFPLTPSNIPVNDQVDTNKNYIINKEFWRNGGSINVGTLPASTLSGFFSTTLAPSQHDGFSMPDIQYFKDANGATETISFNQFVPTFKDQVLIGDITPEFYLNLNCTGAGSETSKYIQFPISFHVNSLSGADATITFQAMNVGGNVNNQVSVSVMQYLGGVLTPITTLYKTFTLTNQWQKYELPITLPSSDTLTLGSTGDDALYLQIGFQAGVTVDINLAMPSLYLSQNVPTNDFSTYDQIDAVINSPRTGDVRTSFNAFVPYGWTAANDGFIGIANPNSLAALSKVGTDTWPLYNLLWSIAKPYDTGSTFNAVCQMVNSSNTAINFGSSAYADWNAGNLIYLSKMFGKVLAGTVPISYLTSVYSQSITASNSAGTLLVTVVNGSFFFVGQPIAFTTTGSLPGNIRANTVYYVSNISGNTFNVCATYANALTNTSPITYLSAGSNSKVNMNILGTNIGENLHTLTINELAAHTHPPLAPSTTYQGQGTGGSYTTTTGGGTNSPLMATTGSTGNSLAHNTMQPTTFMNVFIKL